MTATQRVRRCGVVFVLAVGVAAYLDLGALHFLEREAAGLRASVYASVPDPRKDWARKQIVLVRLSDQSLASLGVPTLQALRRHHADVLGKICEAGAKVVAFDIRFESPGVPEHDTALAEAAAASDRTVWACAVEYEDGSDPSFMLPIPELLERSPHYGHLRLDWDPAGQDRDVDRVTAFMPHDGEQSIRAFSLMAAMMYERLDHGLGLPTEYRWPDGQDPGAEVNGAGQFRISYIGKPPEGETFLRAIDYEDVYDKGADEERFRDKIVLIGETVPGRDEFMTPVGPMWGVEIHGHAIATLLQRRFIRDAPWWGNLLAICLLAGLVCPCAGVCRLQRGVLVAAALLVAYLVLNVWLFVEHALSLHLAAPVTAALLVALGLLTERGLTEEREKNRIRGLLDRYVSPQVAEHIIADPDAYVLGGVEATVTVLFSDIRGFTAMSERMQPQQVVTYLNDYLQAMTEAVFEHDGAVDKYAGDGIMALFGVPVPHEDHARRAVAAAIDMQAALLKLQTRWHTQGLPVADIGIGINTGEVVVGNIGSTRRVDFTVIGDPVNLTERVEGLTKSLSARILVTEDTYRHVEGEVRALGPMAAAVEGREGEVVVYEVLGWGDGT